MLFATLPAATAQIKSGALKAIAVTGSKRSPEFPALPTVAESGLKGFEVVTWTGLFMPSKTPKDVVEKLNHALNQALRDPAIQAGVEARSSEVAISTPAEFAELVRRDTAQWATVIREANIKLE
jgi:tripartite-type tricarboxylate transporter receptor subunit TctC